MSAPLIAIVANSTWNIVNFRLGLIRRLQSEGFRVLVIAPTDKYTAQLTGVRQIYLKNLHPKSKSPLDDFLLCRELYQTYQKEQPDLILHYTIKPNIYGNFAARWANIPTISTLTGLGYTFLHGNFTKFLIRRLYKVALAKSKQIIFHNSDDLKLFQQLDLIKKGRASVIYGSGVNTDYFSSRECSQKHPLLSSPNKLSSKFILLFVGRLLYDKGVEEFVAAANEVAKSVKNAEFWIVGELNAENPAAISETQLNKWLSNPHLQYLGATEDVRPYLQKADVFVLPSYREGMPRAVLEAMSMKKPIITTETAGCRDTVVEGKNGFLVPVKNSIALAIAMIKMCEKEKSELEKMGTKSRELVLEKFAENIIIDGYLSLIKEVVRLK